MSTITDLVPKHFGTLGATDVLDFGDGYSRLLKPDRATGTALDHLLKAFADIVVGSRLASWQHVNFHTFSCLFQAIDRMIDLPVILETGSSAHGVNSSLLFAALAQATGGSFDTVDLNPATVARVRDAIARRFGTFPDLRCHCGDSVEFIRGYAAAPNIVYLDSYDLNPGDFVGSAHHGLLEFEAVVAKLGGELALILIDDTPRTREIFRKMCAPEYLTAVDRHVAATGRLPGKGELIVEAIAKDRRFEILEWEYQLLLAYRPQ